MAIRIVTQLRRTMIENKNYNDCYPNHSSPRSILVLQSRTSPFLKGSNPVPRAWAYSVIRYTLPFHDQSLRMIMHTNSHRGILTSTSVEIERWFLMQQAIHEYRLLDSSKRHKSPYVNPLNNIRSPLNFH